MPFKNRQKQREYQREWIKRKRAGLPTKTRNPSSQEERKKKMLIYRKKYYLKRKRQAEELLGNQCSICGRKENLVMHKKDGKSHSEKTQLWIWNQIIKNPSEWIRLCHRCHTAIHWIMEYFGWKWEKILSHIAETY
jgi:hypothetical protein